jgi:uncharacterized protein (TIGR02147 family)
MSEPIFQFTNAIDYLNYQFECRRLKNSRFSLRAWAKQLGYENPSFLSHLLKRERRLKLDVAEKFSANLKLNGDSKNYFDLLVLLGCSKTMQEKQIYMDLLLSLRPGSSRQTKTLDIEVFRVISDWHHLAILEMVELRGFESDAQWITNRLGCGTTEQLVEKAIARLLQLELLEKSRQGKLKRVRDNSILLESSIPAEAIRHFHSQMLEKALRSIEGDSVDQRDLRGTTIAIKRSDFIKVQSILKRAHMEVLHLASRGDGDEVYHLSSQFFKITGKKEK